MSVIASQMPKKVSMEKADDFCGVFTVKPLEKGYGVTLGNALRRVLLSSLEGYAITYVKIPDIIQHEFSTIHGVVEDVTELILNLKKVRFKKIVDTSEEKILISVSNQAVFKAGDIAKATSSFEILNPELIICNLDKSIKFEIEITIEKGRGYVPAEENKPSEQVFGLIPIDAIFTPIKNVKYYIENTRVEQKTDYEKLVIEVQTDQSIHPKTALKDAANILINHFMLFSDKSIVWESDGAMEVELLDEEFFRVSKLLKTPLTELGLSVRALNCLKSAKLKLLADVVELEVADIMKLRNFGEKSRNEIIQLIEKNKLNFGMDLSIYKLD